LRSLEFYGILSLVIYHLSKKLLIIIIGSIDTSLSSLSKTHSGQNYSPEYPHFRWVYFNLLHKKKIPKGYTAPSDASINYYIKITAGR